MKPFYTNKVLFEATTDELRALRVATANEMERWSDTREDGTKIFPDIYERYQELLKDLTKIIETLPF